MKKSLPLVFLFLSIFVLACEEYEFVPNLYFEVQINSDLKSKSGSASITLHKFNLSDANSVSITELKIGDEVIENFSVAKSKTNLVVSFTLPENADEYNTLRIAANSPSRNPAGVTKQY
ncbi:MAG: hypothetical protein SFU27_01650 [Thermonemataceae bacterium]|nr:hypothetical protein [Thermonemataceae bacterium]